MKNFKLLFFFLVIIFLLPFQTKAADQPQQAQQTGQQNPIIVKAKVIEIVSTGQEQGDNGQNVPSQDIKVRILEGSDAGKTVEFTNDYVMLKIDDDLYLSENPQPDGTVQYSMKDPYRINAIIMFLLIFLVLVWLFGGFQGLRGLVSLFGSLLLITFVLVPSILHGFSPFIASFGIAGIIIIVGSYITHGFNKTTTVAVIAMILTVAATALLTYWAINATYLQGFGVESALYLNSYGSNAPNIDLVGLLYGGIMIGLLGVLYDVAISQAISVEELHKVASHLSRWTIYKRAIRIGREHIGALVGTLAIAYIGVSLPLILLYAKTGFPFLVTINQEVFATEIIRILVSSIGLIIAVPITTLLAIYIVIRKQGE